MTSRSLFIARPEDAQRHVSALAKGLRKIAIVGWVAGVGCSGLAMLVTHVFVTSNSGPNPVPGFQELSGIAFVAWFMAVAMLAFSSLYFVAGWGLANQKPWGRYVGAGAFVLKVLLCLWLGRGSVVAMFVFLAISSWDFYGLWVLLSKETGQLFQSRQPSSTLVYPPAA